MITNDNKKGAKTSHKFHCKLCDYNTGKISNWNRHISTLKHKMITNDNKNEPLRIHATLVAVFTNLLLGYLGIKQNV